MRRMVASAAVIFAGAASLIAGVWIAYSSQIRSIQEADIRQTAAQAENLTRTLANHTQSTIQLVDSTLLILRQQYEQEDEVEGTGRLTQLMETMTSDNPLIAMLGIVDEVGRPVTIRPALVSRDLDVSDPDHLRKQQESGKDEIDISAPVRGRITGRWRIELSRRITRPDGSFAGIVAAAIDPVYFIDLFDGMNLGANGAAALIGLDRIIRARSGMAPEAMGQSLAHSQLFAAIGDRREGSVRSVSTIDGIDRIVAFQTLERFPLMLTVGLAVEDIQANRRDLTNNVLLVAILASLMIAITAGFVWLQQASLAKLTRSEERFRSLVQTSSAVIVGLSPTGAVREFNPEAERLHGVAREEVLGQPYFERFVSRAAAGTVPDLDTVLASPAAIRFDTTMRGPGGSERILSWSAVRQRDTRGRPSGIIATAFDITERKRAEERLRQILAEAPLPTVIVRLADNRVIFINRRAAEMFALPEERLDSLVSDDFVMDEEARRRYRARLAEAGRVDNIELQFRTALGEPFWALLSATLIDYGGEQSIVVSLNDITDRKRTETALRDSEERFRLLAENATDLIMLHASDGTNLYASPACTRLLGFEPADMIGQNAFEFFHPDDLTELQLAPQAITADTEGIPATYRIRRKNGTWTWFETLSRPVINAATGAVTEIVTVSRDVSERIGYEHALREERDRIKEQGIHLAEVARHLEIARREADQARLAAEQARLAAEEASNAKSQFLATMSHELRTPLNAILGFSEIIKNQMFGPDALDRYTEYAADIHSSGQHLLDLINDILDISKIEAGKLMVEPECLDLAEILESTVRLLRERAEERGLALAVELTEAPPELWADRRAMRQILVNLVSNAIKFTPSGGRVSISVMCTDDDTLTLSVTDTGIGIPPDQIDRIFQPFEQIDNRYSRAEGGTGLGLPLVKALTELHGGSLAIASEVDKGTTVTVRLPLHPAGE